MPLKTSQQDNPTIDLTPMIDIVFQLIIFFMVAAKFTEMENRIPLQVPQVSQAGPLAPAPEKRVISVYRDGRIALDREVLSLEELTARLAAARQEYADLGVVVRGDAEGAFQSIADVLAACRTAGIADLGISVREATRRR